MIKDYKIIILCATGIE